MSGIVGIYYLDGRSVDQKSLRGMVDILAHRGPDGSDLWCEDSVGLGHRMLWTTPESLWEKLPLVNSTSDLVITADARIDNRDELITALGLEDCPPEKIPDSQLILTAYERWGEQCTEKLLGDFAFAIWDGRQQVLFCARDHFGVKPLYYYGSTQTFVCATEIKAIFGLPEVPRQLNEIRFGDYLTTNLDDTAITSYQNIRRLSPAHSLKVSAAGVQIKSYWSLDPSREIRLDSDEEYAEAFRQIFTEAVRCRLRSAFPVGSMLSGGLDSSSVTCVARNLLAEQGEQPLPTFSGIFDQITQCDERSFINAVLAQGGLEPHYLHGDQRSPLTDLERILWHEDEAFHAPGLAIMTWGLWGIAKERGVRVLLDGHDGDGTVSHGFGYLGELARAGRWLTLAVQLRGLAKIYNQSFGRELWLYVWHYGFNPLIAKTKPLRLVRRIWRSLLRRVRSQGQSTHQPKWSANLNPDFVERIGLEERYRAWRQAQHHSGQTEREVHYRTLTQGLQPFALEVFDKAAAAFSLENRYPFWDKRLVEFCLALPPEQKLYQGWSRMVMRRAMTNILPPEVQWRTSKIDFLPNIAHGLRTFERERLDELILHNSGVWEKYVNLNALREAYQRFVSPENQETPDDVFLIWEVASLALWLRYVTQNHSDGFRKDQEVVSVE